MGNRNFRSRLALLYYDFLSRCLEPFAAKLPSPNALTLASLAVSLFSGYAYARGWIFTAGLLLLAAGFIDTLDGTIARMHKKVTRFGALLDSTVDRYAEWFVFIGLIIHFRKTWVLFIVLAALMGSIMVSYVKARAEGLGVTEMGGLMQRPERLLLLIAGSLANPVFVMNLAGQPDGILVTVITILAVLGNMTALQRLIDGRKNLDRLDR
ncbi:MAG: CDP-alcohol phosphatidyltransferase family protein [Deltaproteobacteria bacterium]|nr:CDP-alcohol phosphatidyltransferase family protein [Deltaproteobacteria bacterium]